MLANYFRHEEREVHLMYNSISKSEEKLKDNIIAILAIFTVPALNAVYTVLNRHNGVVYSLVTTIDDRIPFIRYFILPYNLWYPFILVSLFYLCFKDRKTFYKTVIAIDIGLIICYAIYIVFQTTVERPELAGGDIFTRLVAFTYAMDPPYNCFPSIHVLTSYLVIKAYLRGEISSKFIRSIIHISGTTIIISTLFVKQHVILDIAGAVILGDITLYISRFIDEERIIGWIKKLYSSLMMKKKLET
jgi:hypothetical protein